MPAVAVIPAPLLFNKIVAVKKLVVGIVGDFYVLAPSLPLVTRVSWHILHSSALARGSGLTLRKLKRFKHSSY